MSLRAYSDKMFNYIFIDKIPYHLLRHSISKNNYQVYVGTFNND